MDLIWEKARDIGRLVAQTDEYQALKRANERLADDREAVTRLNRLQELEAGFTRSIQHGVEPPQEEQDEYERLALEVQGLAGYQALIAAQSNFERLMMRVQEEIAKGVEMGQQSRIILTS
ncbi:MAG TPA: YlbF family regulator [Longimicrobium sp.]|nr:YlbF family regulator [Longimicrobium sp.]